MKIAIYSRKSRLSEKGESIENQVQLCKEYAEKNFNKIEDIKIYEDEGFSGKDINRPEFQKMMKRAKDKKFDILICYRLDRISRNVADFSNTIETLQKYNIDFVSIREQFDTNTPMGRAMMNVAAVFAQLERETIAERIKDNMIELAKTGRWLGGTAPLGYKSEPVKYINEDGKAKKMYKLIQVPEEIKTVKLIFQLYLEKRGFNSVATYLCKNMYKGKNGGEFSRGTVQQIIDNPVYCISDDKIFEWFKKQNAAVCGSPDGKHGLMVYSKRKNGKKEKPLDEWIVAIGKHEGIISSENWLKCQQITNENKLKTSPRSGTGEKFLLSGLVVCGECKSGMASWSHYNKKYDFMERYYRCNLRNRASNRCSNKMLNAYKAQEYIENYLKNVDINTLISEYYKNKKTAINTNNTKNEINSLNKKYEDNEKIIQGLIRKIALMNDDIQILKIIKEEIEKLNNENTIIKDKISKLTTSLDNYEDDEKVINSLTDSLLNFKKFYDYLDIEGKRILIKSMIDCIEWYGENEELKVNFKGFNINIGNGIVRRRNN